MERRGDLLHVLWIDIPVGIKSEEQVPAGGVV